MALWEPRLLAYVPIKQAFFACVFPKAFRDVARHYLVRRL